MHAPALRFEAGVNEVGQKALAQQVASRDQEASGINPKALGNLPRESNRSKQNGHGSKARTASEHPNPLYNRLKLVVHPPQYAIGFDPQPMGKEETQQMVGLTKLLQLASTKSRSPISGDKETIGKGETTCLRSNINLLKYGYAFKQGTTSKV